MHWHLSADPPGNAKFVTVMPYLWNGRRKKLLEREEVEQRGAEIGQQMNESEQQEIEKIKRMPDIFPPKSSLEKSSERVP